MARRGRRRPRITERHIGQVVLHCTCAEAEPVDDLYPERGMEYQPIDGGEGWAALERLQGIARRHRELGHTASIWVDMVQVYRP